MLDEYELAIRGRQRRMWELIGVTLMVVMATALVVFLGLGCGMLWHMLTG